MLNKVIIENATNLIDEIKSLSGDKIITCVGETDNFTIDILANGQIGYQVNHHELFIEKLIQYMSEKGGLTVTVRRELGSDINAACGQLRKSHLDEK